jgi:hypothetical protein
LGTPFGESCGGLGRISFFALSGWLIYWFQSIPSKDNGLKYQGEDGSEISITNWWDLYYNCDSNIANGKKLYN